MEFVFFFLRTEMALHEMFTQSVLLLQLEKNIKSQKHLKTAISFCQSFLLSHKHKKHFRDYHSLYLIQPLKRQLGHINTNLKINAN